MFSQKQTGSQPNKQKVIIGVIVIISIVVLWQLKGMFFSGGQSQPTTVAANKTSATMAKNPANAQPTSTAAPVPQQANVPAAPQINETTVPKDNTILMTQQEIQRKYLESLNELQMLRIQKEIIETKQAIASADLARVTAEKSIEDVLKPPVASPPPNPYVSGAPQGAPGAGDAWNEYIVLSVVSNTTGRWNAVIGYHDKHFVVSVGDILPPDGSRVIAISRQGVTLENDGKKKQITLVSSI